MASMSPPASSEAPTPVKKPRGRPAGGGPGKKKATAKDGAEGSTPRGTTGSGRGRKKRQSTVDSHGASTPSGGGGGGSGLPGMNTPGSSYPSPGIAGIASMLEEEANSRNQRDREGSQFSMGRKSTATGAGGRAATRGETGTQADGEGDEEDEEDDDDEDEDMNFGDDAYDEQAKERAEAKEALRMLLDQFGPEQLERYETYRRSGLPNASIRRLVNHVLQQACTPSIVLAVRGLSKVFVGEIVELARQIQADANETGPLTPDHLREAYARYKSVQDKRGSSRSKLFVR